MEKELTIDERLKALEQVIKTLESEDISLEDALKEFEKGVVLVKESREILDGIEKKLKILTEGMEDSTDDDLS
ncbi:MAG: exodeoxyribonuclease VII small subunit [Lachnospiraceae bacterium]|nr:exodeoxyribonuclease VII small subunit [Lachnospiraceae bacterium]